MDGAVNFNVDVITDLVGAEVGGECDGSLLPEWAREGVSGATSQTMTRRHFHLLGMGGAWGGKDKEERLQTDRG